MIYFQTNSGRYSRFKDFNVVLQPGLEDLDLPKSPIESPIFAGLLGNNDNAVLPDLSYLAPNCLYPSQKLQALSKHFNFLKYNLYSIISNLVAKSIWNNLVEEYSFKSKFSQTSSLKCPNPDLPLIRTYENSRYPDEYDDGFGESDFPSTDPDPFVRVKRKKLKKSDDGVESSKKRRSVYCDFL